jgi:hypothetical protein
MRGWRDGQACCGGIGWMVDEAGKRRKVKEKKGTLDI